MQMPNLNSIKNFYVKAFKYVVDKLRKVVAWNKGLVNGIWQDYDNGDYAKAVLKSLGYILLFVTQASLFICLVVSYVACKLTGICIII